MLPFMHLFSLPSLLLLLLLLPLLLLLLLLLQGDHGVLHQHDVGHTGAAQHMATHQRAAAKVRVRFCAINLARSCCILCVCFVRCCLVNPM
jgi:hypothetical protein